MVSAPLLRLRDTLVGPPYHIALLEGVSRLRSIAREAFVIPVPYFERRFGRRVVTGKASKSLADIVGVAQIDGTPLFAVAPG